MRDKIIWNRNETIGGKKLGETIVHFSIEKNVYCIHGEVIRA